MTALLIAVVVCACAIVGCCDCPKTQSDSAEAYMDSVAHWNNVDYFLKRNDVMDFEFTVHRRFITQVQADSIIQANGGY